MPPELTETWAASYAQILITLLVFALGIPGLIFQIVIPEDLRRITHRQAKTSWWYISLFVLMGLTAISTLLFIWLLHPQGPEPVPAWKSYFASIAVSVAVLSVSIYWWLRLGRRGRRSLVTILGRNLAKSYRDKEVLNSRNLSDLIYLGEQGKPGYEKKLVLDAFDILAEEVQNSKHYRGVDLEDFIHGFEDILGNKGEQGNDRNYSQAAEILLKILRTLSDKKLDASPDAGSCIKVLRVLAVQAIKVDSIATYLRFLDAGKYDSGILYEMGVIALESKKYYIAAMALNKIKFKAEEEAKTEVEGKLQYNETTANLLGILSHFWVTSGATHKMANNYICKIENSFYPSLPDCIQESSKFHFDQCNFETFDNLIHLLNDSGKGFVPYKDKVLTSSHIPYNNASGQIADAEIEYETIL